MTVDFLLLYPSRGQQVVGKPIGGQVVESGMRLAVSNSSEVRDGGGYTDHSRRSGDGRAIAAHVRVFLLVIPVSDITDNYLYMSSSFWQNSCQLNPGTATLHRKIPNRVGWQATPRTLLSWPLDVIAALGIEMQCPVGAESEAVLEGSHARLPLTFSVFFFCTKPGFRYDIFIYMYNVR
jgi:hypothetical protein